MRVLLLIPSVLKPRRGGEDGDHPTMDYHALADRLIEAHGATVDMLGYREVEESGDPGVAAARRAAGQDAALALLGRRALRRGGYDAVFTNGENVGIPLSLILRGAVGRRPGHVTIGHRITPKKKLFFLRTLGLHRQMDTIFVYARTQHTYGIAELGIPMARLPRIAFHADTRFWTPQPGVPEDAGLICSAGLEWRDYPTLIETIRVMPGMRLDIAAASPWSKHRNETEDRTLPANVQAQRYDYAGLRDLYARSSMVAVPLYENDFQAGVTTLLEAMAMGKAVICTRTTGQTDVVEDGRNGLCVPPGDSAAWQRAISLLRNDADLRGRLGESARRWTLEHASLDRWTETIADAIIQSVPGLESSEKGERRGPSLGSGPHPRPLSH